MLDSTGPMCNSPDRAADIAILGVLLTPTYLGALAGYSIGSNNLSVATFFAAFAMLINVLAAIAIHYAIRYSK